MPKYNSNLINYLLKYKYMTGLLLYFVFSVILKIFTSLDILLPCIWKSVFNFECIGCGLTTAFLKLLHFNITGAFNSNPLIFIIIPSLLYYIITDFRLFSKTSSLIS